MPQKDIEIRRVSLEEYQNRYCNMDEAKEDGWQILMEQKEDYRILTVHNPKTSEILQITPRLYSLFSSLYSNGFERGHKKGLGEAIALLKTKKRKSKSVKRSQSHSNSQSQSKRT